MKTLKLKYLLGFIVFTCLTIYTSYKPEKYSVLIPVIMTIMMCISIFLLWSDRNEAKKYVVIDEDRKPIKSFIAEEDAIDFANNQDKDTKVVMLNIK